MSLKKRIVGHLREQNILEGELMKSVISEHTESGVGEGANKTLGLVYITETLNTTLSEAGILARQLDTSAGRESRSAVSMPT